MVAEIRARQKILDDLDHYQRKAAVMDDTSSLKYRAVHAVIDALLDELARTP
jgi:hypothetical protein